MLNNFWGNFLEKLKQFLGRRNFFFFKKKGVFTVPLRPFAFSKAMSHIFSGWVFFRLNLWAGNKSEINISNPHAEAYFQPNICGGAFFAKIVNMRKKIKKQLSSIVDVRPGSK